MFGGLRVGHRDYFVEEAARFCVLLEQDTAKMETGEGSFIGESAGTTGVGMRCRIEDFLKCL